MIFRTAASIYEVQEYNRRFRRIHETSASHHPIPVGRWYQFERMSPVTLGEPVRFFWMFGEDDEPSRIGLWSTGAVVGLLPDDAPSFLVPARP